jgi:peptide deformylase
MGIVPIEKFGAEVLDPRAAELTEFSEDLETIARDMIETMYAAPGVGLAAPQIGLGIRLMVIDITVGEDPKQVIVMANPVMVEQDGEQHEEEGCLSVPGYSGIVSRPAWVKVRGQDLKGKRSPRGPAFSRAFCHEIDHLDGSSSSNGWEC